MTSQKEDFGDVRTPTKCLDITVLLVTTLANISASVAVIFLVRSHGGFSMRDSVGIQVICLI